MASLILSSPTLNHSSSQFRHPKPRRHSLTVRCAAADDGKVDRRNMLLGLGGLYGASSLISTPGASANPIQPPVLDKCGNSSYTNKANEKVEINCCPPFSDKIIDYELPPVFQMKVRPAAHSVTPEQMFKYNMAIDRMRRLPKDDPRSFMQQANIHCAYCNGGYDQPGQGTLDLQVHNSWLFFPFHRWYLYFYERILGKLIGDPNFALPFWNWDNPKGMTIPPIFMDPKSALYDAKRDQTHLPPNVVDLGMTNATDPDQLRSNNLSIMYTEMIRGNSSAEDFMGKPYREGSKEADAGPGASERGSHTGIHVYVGDPNQPAGEDMGNFYSAGRDPLFYCHHANVDRMWSLWQYFLPAKKLNFEEKKITDPDFLKAAFVFYDENAQLVRVTVKDCLDNLRMGFDYERVDLPWLNYKPPPQAAGARIKKISPSEKPVFPLKLDKIVRVEVPKTKKGKAEELLVIEDITVDTSKVLKFDVFVNDEDESAGDVGKASYAGTYAQVPRKSATKTVTTSISLKLTEVYCDLKDIEDDDTVVVTLVPRHQGPGVTIGGIKIVADPKPDPRFKCPA